jgi:hypothetical protein
MLHWPSHHNNISEKFTCSSYPRQIKCFSMYFSVHDIRQARSPKRSLISRLYSEKKSSIVIFPMSNLPFRDLYITFSTCFVKQVLTPWRPDRPTGPWKDFSVPNLTYCFILQSSQNGLRAASIPISCSLKTTTVVIYVVSCLFVCLSSKGLNFNC